MENIEKRITLWCFKFWTHMVGLRSIFSHTFVNFVIFDNFRQLFRPFLERLGLLVKKIWLKCQNMGTKWFCWCLKIHFSTKNLRDILTNYQRICGSKNETLSIMMIVIINIGVRFVNNCHNSSFVWEEQFGINWIWMIVIIDIIII